MIGQVKVQVNGDWSQFMVKKNESALSLVKISLVSESSGEILLIEGGNRSWWGGDLKGQGVKVNGKGYFKWTDVILLVKIPQIFDLVRDTHTLTLSFHAYADIYAYK